MLDVSIKLGSLKVVISLDSSAEYDEKQSHRIALFCDSGIFTPNEINA